MAGGVSGGFSRLLDALLAEKLCLSPLAKSSEPPFLSATTVVLSGLSLVTSLPSLLDLDLNTSLIFDPGETLPDELEGSSELLTDSDESFFLTAKVLAARGARLDGTGGARVGAGSVRERRFSLLAKLVSLCAVAVIWGEVEVR